MTASAFSLSAAIPSDGFLVTQGTPVIGGLHGSTRHYFCPHCMSWMYTRAAVLDWFVNRRPTMLDSGMEHTLHRDLHQGKAPLGQHACDP
jgi:hypothetical protein